MNRYESAYRDYTIQRGGTGGDSADESTLNPQRPERSKSGRAGRAIRGVKDTTSDSSAESHLGGGFDANRMAQTNPGFSSTDEESFIHQPNHVHRHHQISSRELSDRSGGERSNPDFLVANDAIQTYQRYRPIHQLRSAIFFPILLLLLRGKRNSRN